MSIKVQRIPCHPLQEIMNNILITSAGRRVSLLRSFQKSLKERNLNDGVYASDAHPLLSSACRIADKFFHAPSLSDPHYKNHLLELCRNNSIKLVIPTIDTELLILADAHDEFLNHGIHLMVSDTELVRKCRDKRLTHSYFKEHNIPVPQDADPLTGPYPVFSKPSGGSSGIGVIILNNKEEVTKNILDEPGRMFLQYLSPADYTEYTCDLYYNRLHTLCCVVPRQRIAVRSGEVSKGVTRNNFLVNYIYDRLTFLQGARGCITLQVFVKNNSETVFGIEINPRFGGGFPLSYEAGADFPGWLIDEYILHKEVFRHQKWKEDLLMLRYDDHIIVDGFKDNI